MSKIFKVFLLLFKCRYVFKKPNKADILLYDQGQKFNETFKQIFSKKKVEILLVRYEELNLYVLIKSLKSLNFSSFNSFFSNYLKTYCQIVGPEWILTSTDYDKNFFLLKKILKLDVKFAIIQRAPIFPNHFDHLKKIYPLDYIFCFDKKSKDIYEKHFDAHITLIGSFRSNEVPIKKNKKIKSLLVISGFKKEFILLNQKKTKINDKSIKITDIFHEKKLISLLRELSKKSEIKFKILLKPFVDTKLYSEFNNIDENFCIYNDGTLAYETVDQFNVIIFPNDSALRFESIYRGKKICIIRPLHQIEENINLNYIFTEELNYLNISNFLSSLLQKDEDIFFNENTDLKDMRNLHDFKNTKIKSIIN